MLTKNVLIVDFNLSQLKITNNNKDMHRKHNLYAFFIYPFLRRWIFFPWSRKRKFFSLVYANIYPFIYLCNIIYLFQ